MPELDDYTKCVIVGGKTAPLRLEKSEIDELLKSRAFMNIRRQACARVAVLIDKMANPETTESEWRTLQGEFNATRWLIQSKERLIREWSMQQADTSKDKEQVVRNESRLEQLLEGRETE